MSRSLYIPFLLFSLIFFACENEIPPSEVPSIVKNTFKNRFSKAIDMEWKVVQDNYEVSFEINDIDYTAALDKSGTLLKYKYEIDRNKVSGPIKSFLASEFPKKNWEDPECIIYGNSEYFQLEIDGMFNDKKLVIDSMGRLLENVTYWN